MQEFYLLLCLGAAFTSFNLGIYYLFRTLGKDRAVWLPIGILIFSICLFFNVYELGQYFLVHPRYLWLNVPLLFLIGPLFYLQTQNRPTLLSTFHFLPFLCFLSLLTPIYLLPDENKSQIIASYYHPGTRDVDLFQYLYLLHIGLYTWMGYRSLDPSKRHLRLFYGTFCAVSLLSFAGSYLFDKSAQYLGKPGAHTFALLSLSTVGLQFYLSYWGFEPPHHIVKPKSPSGKRNQTANSKLFLRFEILMRTEHLQRDPQLKIADVAQKLQVSVHALSAAINEEHGQNFFDYINRLRIEELKPALLHPNNRHLTFLAIAKASGFNSNSSFYRVFRKYVGCTPKQYVALSQSIK